MSKFAAMSDHELAELYEQGVDKAFDVLLERNQEALYAYVMRLLRAEHHGLPRFENYRPRGGDRNGSLLRNLRHILIKLIFRNRIQRT